MRLAALASLIGSTALAGCGTVARDYDYIGAEYAQSEPASPVTVDGPDGAITFNTRMHPRADKLLVVLDTGAIKRALAKDLGTEGNALPKASFEAAANKRLGEAKGPECVATSGLRRQDYLWEFDYVCGTPAERDRKAKMAAKCGGSISCEYREERNAKQRANCDKNGGVTVGMSAAQIMKSCWGKPRSVNETLTGTRKHEQWIYGDGQYLYLDNGVLTSIQTSR